jgi:ABC-type glycerol-3-phosphate transport system substrate-binding protein
MQKNSIPHRAIASTISTPQPLVRHSRRAFLRLGVMLTASLAVSACVGAEQSFVPSSNQPEVALTTQDPLSREEMQLVYQDWRTDWFPEVVEEMLAQFHTTHPEIRVFFTPDPEQLPDAMLAEMAAGTAPDVFWGGSTFFPTWAQQGQMLDLRPYVAMDLDDITIAEWDPAQYRAFFLRDGRQFGFPKYHVAVAL